MRMNSLNRIVIFTMGIAFGMADMALVQHHRQNHRKPLPSDCIALRGVTDFCFAPGCTINRASNGFDLNCSNGLTGHFVLQKLRDL
jgi:hypothetical protein